MAEPNTIYKMTVLCLLSKVTTPLSNAQIIQFFLDREYTDYFTIQQVVGDLQEANLIAPISMHNQTLYQMTDEGDKTLSLMKDKINPEIEQDIVKFLAENQLDIAENISLIANYDKATGGGYVVHCKYLNDSQVIVDLTLHASSLGQAETICNNWKARHEEVYMSLMDTLIQ